MEQLHLFVQCAGGENTKTTPLCCIVINCNIDNGDNGGGGAVCLPC